MKHSILIIPLVALSFTCAAQRPADVSQAGSSNTTPIAPREVLYNVTEKHEPAPAYHDWKQSIAEKNSAFSGKACDDYSRPGGSAAKEARDNAGPVANQRFRGDPDAIYYYSGTPYTWERTHGRKTDSLCKFGYLQPSDLGHTGDPAFELASCLTYINFYTPLPARNNVHAKYYYAYAFDGYIVYKGDTIPGVVTMGYDRVTVENMDARGAQKKCISLLDNLLLRDIVVYSELRELHMRRPTKNDKRMWRQLLHGKLNVYDKRYAFVTSRNIDTRSLRMQYGNGALHRVHSKGQLVAALNRTYQLKLKADKYSWKELFDLMATLG